MEYPFASVGAPPTEQDVINLQQIVNDLSARGNFDGRPFSELLSNRPPAVIFNEPSVAKDARIVAAYFPDRNVITFKTGKTSPEAVKHEFFHAAQNYFLGASFCSQHDCEGPAYAFEDSFHKVLFMLGRPHYDPRTDWIKFA